MTPERIKELTDNGLLEETKKLFTCLKSKDDYVNFKTGEVEMDFNTALEVWWFYKYSDDFNDCLKIIHADNTRYNRLLKRIKWFMDMGTCLFFTLTFTDHVLESTEEETRRKYVRRFLKNHSSMYLANIDYGSKSGREHYHGVIVCSDPSIIDNWQYGYSNAQIISDRKDDKERISKYMLKIANHFVKSSVRRNYVIYSRNNIDFKDPTVDCIKFFIGKKFQEIWHLEYDLDQVKNKQLKFWEHLPSASGSNFDFDDYM